MKKIIFTTVLAVFSISVHFAQDSKEFNDKTFNFGLRSGLQNYTYDIKNDRRNFNTFYGGLFVEKQLSEKWHLQLEANYFTPQLLSFPLFVKYSFTKKFAAYIGTELNFSFNQGDIDERFRNKQFGGSFVLGAMYHIDSNWFIEGRYTYGFTDQFPVSSSNNSDIEFGKIRSLSLGLGFKF